MKKLTDIVLMLAIAGQAHAGQLETIPKPVYEAVRVSAPSVSIKSESDRNRILGVYYLLCRNSAYAPGLGDFQIKGNECYEPLKVKQDTTMQSR